MGEYLFVGAVISVTAMLRGLVLRILWAWYVSPIFGLPGLGFPVAVGIGLLLAVATHQYSIRNLMSTEKGPDMFVNWMLEPLFLLLLGAIFHLFS